MSFVAHTVAQAFGHIGSHSSDLAATSLRTVLLAIASTLTAALVGLPLGCALGAGAGRSRGFARIASNAGLGLPPVVLGVFVALALLPKAILGGLGWSNTVDAIVLAQTLLALPIVVALTAAAVTDLPVGMLDQARAFGARRLRVMVFALSEARAGVAIAVFATFGSALAEVGAVIIVGGNIRGETNTLASTVILDLAAGDAAAATANLIILLGLTLAAGLAFTLAQRDKRVHASAAQSA